MTLRNYALLAAISVSTAATAQNVDFGLQGGLVIPSGGMTKVLGSDAALGLGAQLRIKLRGGHALVPRLDYVKFTGEDDRWAPPADVSESLLSLGVDYNYYVSRRVGQGFYFGGGLGFLQMKEEYSAPAGYYFEPGDDPSETKNRFYLSTGLGVAVNKHLSFFGRVQFFFDDQKGEVWNSNTHEYEKTYELSTMWMLGAEVHF